MTSKNKIIAIIGGMGPASGEFLQSLLFDEMRSNLQIKKDQDYLDIVHYSFGSDIPDRTTFLEGKTNQNPAFSVFKIFQQLEMMAQIYERSVIGCIACNTFFADPIFKKFLTLWDQEPLQHVKCLNLIERTVNFIKMNFQLNDQIGILTTSGERKLKVYQTFLEKIGIKVLHLEPENQEKLHQAIYKIKSNPFYAYDAHETILTFIDLLISRGAKKVLLGCTEISLAINHLGFDPSYHVDPLRIIAQESLLEASK